MGKTARYVINRVRSGVALISQVGYEDTEQPSLVYTNILRQTLGDNFVRKGVRFDAELGNRGKDGLYEVISAKIIPPRELNDKEIERIWDEVEEAVGDRDC